MGRRVSPVLFKILKGYGIVVTVNTMHRDCLRPLDEMKCTAFRKKYILIHGAGIGGATERCACRTSQRHTEALCLLISQRPRLRAAFAIFLWWSILVVA